MSDIIELIDEAIDDRWVSPDAMRWTPTWDEPVVRDPASPVERLMAQGWDGYAAVCYGWGRSISDFAALARVLVEGAAEVVAAFDKALAPFRRFGRIRMSNVAAIHRSNSHLSLAPVPVKPSLRRRGWR